MTQELRDRWEDDSLKTFISIYLRQWRRTRAAIVDAERNEVRQLIGELYRGEPAAVRLEAQRLFDNMVEDIANHTITEVDATLEQPDDLTDTILRLSAENAVRFANQISENSLRLAYSVVDKWLETEGSTTGELYARMQRIWRGPRPKAAATTETTRLYNATRYETFKSMGVWGFRPQHRNDDRVRPSHRDYAAQGPYPLDRVDMIPPYGDINCRCTMSAVIRPPGGS